MTMDMFIVGCHTGILVQRSMMVIAVAVTIVGAAVGVHIQVCVSHAAHPFYLTLHGGKCQRHPCCNIRCAGDRNRPS